MTSSGACAPQERQVKHQLELCADAKVNPFAKLAVARGATGM